MGDAEMGRTDGFGGGESSASGGLTSHHEPSNEERPVGLMDPTGRFERGTELLGRGASKEVYKAFDHEEGVEMAWNQLKVDHLTEQSAAKILSEIQILTQLDNENIIKFYHSWLHRNAAGFYEVFFITELMTSGTLKNYLQKTKGTIKLKVIKNWCRQILKALNYLHTKSPPIIHRDLKCDNIFINGNNGQTKLGDFGLAVLKNREMLTSVLGTPEFMAPELYEESYDEKVDVYAFGMCLLEMVTKDYPYSECDNAAQIYRKVTQGIKPMALQRIADPETFSFIELCIDPNPNNRPTVDELLNHEFILADDSKFPTAAPAIDSGAPNGSPTCVSPSDESLSTPVSSSATTDPYESSASASASSSTSAQANAPEAKLVSCQVDVVSVELPVVNLKMRLLMSVATANKEVKFPFNFENDTVGAVIQEMIKERVLSGSAGDLAATAIKESIKEPLVAYEMARAAAPARAEMDNEQNHLLMQIENAAAAAAAAAPMDIVSAASTSSVSAQSVPMTVHAASDISFQPNSKPIPAPNDLDFVEDNDALIQDHPEVAALLLRQKKEIELLALFHRREHQMLLKSLRRQLGVRSRHESQGQVPVLPVSRAGTPAVAPGTVVKEVPVEVDDEVQFMAKVRHLMYESTGNTAWLPKGATPAPNGSLDPAPTMV